MTRQLPINHQDTPLVDAFHQQIADLVHGNHVDKSEVKKMGCETCRCHIGYQVSWQFVPQVDRQKFAGNYAVSQHFGYNFSQFEQETQQRLAIGKSHKPIRETFVQKILEQNGQSLVDAAKQHRVWDFGQHSVNEECSPCRGSGRVTCSACGGSCRQSCFSCGGRGSTTQTRWVQDYNGQSRSETYQQSCYGCGGSGTQTCNRCAGSGREQCNQCSGQGLFTYIAQVVVQAKPSIQISVESVLSKSELLEFLLRFPVTRIVDYLNLKLSGHRDTAEDTWQVAYEAESKVIELDLGLRKKQYLAAALGQSVLAFRKPPIFDDIFIEEITDLQKIFSKSKKLNHPLARQFFDTYSGQPVLDESMKTIAKLKSDAQSQAGQEVINACQGYISQTSAELLGQSVVKLLDKVSPPNSFWSWMAIMLLPFLLIFFSTQALFETVSRDWLNTFVAALLAFASALVATLVISPLAVLVSSVVSYWRRRSVPAEYRQRGRNWQPLGFFIKSAMLVSLLGMSVGLLARHDWIPRWENKPLLALAHVVAPYVNPYINNQNGLYDQHSYNQTNSYQSNQNQSKRIQPDTQSQRIQPATKTIATNTSKTEKSDPLLLDIQHNLIRLGYDLTVTGSLDNKTRQAIQAYANKNSISDLSSRNLLITLCRELNGRCSNAAKIPY